MIYVFIIACIATLIKAYRDRETFLYNHWTEYFLFWIVTRQEYMRKHGFERYAQRIEYLIGERT